MLLNEAQIITTVQTYLTNAKPATPTVLDFVLAAQTAFEQLDFESAIGAWEKHRDCRAGITSHQFIVAGQSVWLRDARFVDPEVMANDPWENFVIIGLTYLASLKLLLDMAMSQARTKSEDPMERLKLAYNKIKVTGQIFMQEFSSINNQAKATVSLSALRNQVIQMTQGFLDLNAAKAEKYLEFGRDFTNIQVKPLTYVTLTQAQNAVIIEAECPLPVLNGALRAEYTHFKNQHWYQRLSSWQQWFVQYAVPFLLQGHIVPTQLRKVLVGPRNAFMRQVFAWYGVDEWELNFFCYHCGTPGHLFKKTEDSMRATKLSLAALREATQATHIYFDLLLSPSVVRGDEEKVVNQIKQGVVWDEKFHFANTPINGFRLVVDNDIREIDTFCHAITKQSVQADNALWFEGLKLCLIQRLKDSDKSSSENPNLQIQALFLLLLTLLKDPKQIVAILSCMSGKDRTAICLLYCSAFAIVLNNFKRENQPRFSDLENPHQLRDCLLNYFASSQFQFQLQNNMLQLARGGLLQLMAGSIGASRGCARLKSESVSAIPDSMLAVLKPLLFGKSAKINKDPPSVPLNVSLQRFFKADLYLGVKQGDASERICFYDMVLEEDHEIEFSDDLPSLH